MNLNGKKIILTGGAGFVGSNLINHLLKENSDILVLDNFFSGKKEFLPSEIDYKDVDIRSKEIHNIFHNFNPDMIIHLAAIHYIPYCNDNPEETFDVNVIGTRNVLEASKDIDFFFASSAAVYPPIDDFISEDMVGPIDIYGKTKLISEYLVRLYSENAIIGRFFNIYGPNETNPHLIPEIIEQIKKGENEIELGNLTPKRDYIHVNDICESIIALLKVKKPDIYNIGTGKEFSVHEIVNIIIKIINKDIKIIQNENRKRNVEREHLLANIDKLIETTGFKPGTNIENGLQKLLEDY